MSEHICKCLKCHPEQFPEQGPRIDENHRAIRFGTNGDRFLNVYLDGNPVENCFEIKIGSDGWVMRYMDHGNGQIRRCQCGNAPCAEVLHGNVVIEPWSEERIRQRKG